MLLRFLSFVFTERLVVANAVESRVERDSAVFQSMAEEKEPGWQILFSNYDILSSAVSILTQASTSRPRGPMSNRAPWDS